MIIGQKVSVAESLKAFVSAGNTYSGSMPKGGVGDLIFNLGQWGKSGTHIDFGKGCTVKRLTIVCPLGGAAMHFGDKTMISGNVRIEPGCLLSVGDATYFQRPSRLVLYEGAKIQIGRDCLFSNVVIRACDQHAIFDAASGERINHSADIVIEDRVWLAENVTVSKGLTIGSDCVIGSHSVVTKPIPPGCVAVGIPAEVKRTGIRWSKKLPREPARPAKPYEARPVVIEKEPPAVRQRWFARLRSLISL